MAENPQLDATAAGAPPPSKNIEKIREELVAKRGQLQEIERKRMAGEPYDEAAYAKLRDETRQLNELRERIVNRELGVSEFEMARPLDAILDFLATYKVAIFFIAVIAVSVVLLMRLPAGNMVTKEERAAVQKSLGRAPGGGGDGLGVVGGAVLGAVKESLPGKQAGQTEGAPGKPPAPKKTPKATPKPTPAADLPS